MKNHPNYPAEGQKIPLSTHKFVNKTTLLNKKDRSVLRELGCEVAEIAALPSQQKTVSLWKALNRLQPVRPMVMIDQIPWHEMEVNDELTLQTEDEFFRRIETGLRRTLYSWKHMRGDMVVEPVVVIPKAIHIDGFGMEIVEETVASDPKNDVVGHRYLDQLKTEDDVQKIRKPKIVFDEAATARDREKAQEIFDGILGVRMQGCLPGFSMWDFIVMCRGAENVLYDLADRPAFMHQIATRLTDAHLAMLAELEGKGLLGSAQRAVNSSVTYTDELPAPGFDLRHSRAKDLWTCGAAQIFTSVSATMHQEFELNYAIRWYEKFGLVYYGCCEPLHEKIDIIRKISHVRKISMSPWVNVEKGAERIGRDFVFSRKTNPAFLAFETWDPDVVKRDLQDTLERCTRHGCSLEFILKDISTVRYQPQRLWKWTDIAMELVEKCV